MKTCCFLLEANTGLGSLWPWQAGPALRKPCPPQQCHKNSGKVSLLQGSFHCKQWLFSCPQPPESGPESSTLPGEDLSRPLSSSGPLTEEALRALLRVWIQLVKNPQSSQAACEVKGGGQGAQRCTEKYGACPVSHSREKTGPDRSTCPSLWVSVEESVCHSLPDAT